MLILSVKVPSRAESKESPGDPITLELPDGSKAFIHLFYRTGGRVRVGFDLPPSVNVWRQSLFPLQGIEASDVPEPAAS